MEQPQSPPPAVFRTWAAAESDALVVVSGAGLDPIITWINRACAELLAYAPQELVGRPLSTLRRSPLRPGVAGPDGQPLVDPVRILERALLCERRDGSAVRLDSRALPVTANGQPSWVLRLRPQADHARVRDDLHAAQERFRSLSERAPIGIFTSESGLRLGYVNDWFCHLIGVRADQLLGTDWMSDLHPEDLVPAQQALGRVLAGADAELPLRLLRTDGELCHVQARVVPVTTEGRGTGFRGTLEDVTQRLAWERTMTHQAMHDPLTGLPNRRQLLETISARLASSEPAARRTALLFLDLDEFKQVNDSLGHPAGDRVLEAFAERLLGAVRGRDLVARFGGDEFAVMCPGLGDPAVAADVAERLRQQVSDPLMVDGVEVTVAASIGVVVVDDTHSTAEQVLRDADIALYQAKAAGKGQCALFDEEHRRRASDRMLLAGELRRAVMEDQLSVVYQPIVSVSAALQRPDGRGTVSVEALCRWEHPERGPVSPEVFVGLAEQNGAIVELGLSVLRTACRQMVLWQTSLGALAPASVSVNVSPVQLRQPDFVESVAEVLETTGLLGSALTLELTESVLMADPEAAVAAFRSLRSLGIRVAIDDFGTGYSSLALLRTLPLDQLKIDRSFLRDLGRTGDDPFVGAVVALAGSLGLVTVAEGVETVGQLAELERLGCPLAQGFLVSRPVPPEQITAMLVAARLAQDAELDHRTNGVHHLASLVPVGGFSDRATRHT